MKPETKPSPTTPTPGDARKDVLQGTLDLLVLRVLLLEPMHGWAISKRIQQVSREVILVNQGSLYPSLHRLERRGWVKANWGTSENNRRAKFYRLTKAGHAQLDHETQSWHQLARAVDRVLDLA